MKHTASTHKQKSFEETMVQHMKQRPRITQKGNIRVSETLPKKPNPHAQRNDANVLDAVVGKQSLQVVLRKREQHPQHAGYSANRNEDCAPRRRWRTRRAPADSPL